MSTETTGENTGNETPAGNGTETGQEAPVIVETPAGQTEAPGNTGEEKDDPKWLKKILDPLAEAVTTLSQRQSETMDELKATRAELAEFKKSTPQPSQAQTPSGTTLPETKTETSSETKTEPPKESGAESPAETGAEKLLQKARREILKL